MHLWCVFPSFGSMCVFMYLFIFNATDENDFCVKKHISKDQCGMLIFPLLQHVLSQSSSKLGIFSLDFDKSSPLPRCLRSQYCSGQVGLPMTLLPDQEFREVSDQISGGHWEIRYTQYGNKDSENRTMGIEPEQMRCQSV